MVARTPSLYRRSTLSIVDAVNLKDNGFRKDDSVTYSHMFEYPFNKENVSLIKLSSLSNKFQVKFGEGHI